ncbi:hypothetical protein [Knoellia flava]|uniref:hypothetical protein n=1 Tax=Knoellia flava TaxID=913969 RepID=UPI001E5964E7|nr:hypothetical protein [Knoellia flava]
MREQHVAGVRRDDEAARGEVVPHPRLGDRGRPVLEMREVCRPQGFLPRVRGSPRSEHPDDVGVEVGEVPHHIGVLRGLLLLGR